MIAGVVTRHECSTEVGQNDCLGLIRRCTDQNIDTLFSKQSLRSPTHPTCNYHVRTSLRKPAWQQARFVGGSIDFSPGEDLLGLQIGIYQGEALTVSKVGTEPAVGQRDGKTHYVDSFCFAVFDLDATRNNARVFKI
jgi:hypothetical protein